MKTVIHVHRSCVAGRNNRQSARGHSWAGSAKNWRVNYAYPSTEFLAKYCLSYVAFGGFCRIFEDFRVAV